MSLCLKCVSSEYLPCLVKRRMSLTFEMFGDLTLTFEMFDDLTDASHLWSDVMEGGLHQCYVDVIDSSINIDREILNQKGIVISSMNPFNGFQLYLYEKLVNSLFTICYCQLCNFPANFIFFIIKLSFSD